MKKRKLLLALGIAGITTIALASCSKGGTDVYSADASGNVIKIGKSEITFKENSEIPYLNLADGVQLMSLIRTNNLDNEKYKYSVKKEDNDFVISNETGAKCSISTTNQTLAYDDYDKFVSLVPDKQEALSLVPIRSGSKALKQSSGKYTKGQSVTMDLKKYSKLDVYTKDNKCYIPLSVFNSALLTASENASLAYNGKNLFMIVGDSLKTEGLLGKTPSALGYKFRENSQKESITKDYLDYYYQSLCFDFDYQYGLKDKFESFDDFLKDHYKNEMLSTNPKTIDNYTAIALSYLNDGHTTLTDFSNLYEFNDNKIDRSKANPIKCKWEEDDEAFTETKTLAGIKNGIEYKGDTVFVQFEQFTVMNEDFLYSKKKDNKDSLDDFGNPGLDFDILKNNSIKENDTCYMLSKLYKDLTTDQTKKNQVKNIVIDLTTNAGGATDALLYSLNTLIGTVTIDITNPLTGASNHQSYKADINTDGVIDANDKSLSELGFNIYFLNSKYSFSSANAMPYLAKLNKPNVVNLGDKTAGGPCPIKYMVTPIGSVYISSSLNTLSKLKDGKYVNIDDGIPADFTLTESQMINRDYIVANINNWTLNK